MEAAAVEQQRLLEQVEGLRLPDLVLPGQPFAKYSYSIDDRMALFIPSHLILYVRGETAENCVCGVCSREPRVDVHCLQLNIGLLKSDTSAIVSQRK